MPVSPSRRIAFDILSKVEAGRAFAADLLQAGQAAELKPADHRLATEIVMGVLRWRGELDFQVKSLSARPMSKLDKQVQTTLRMGVYQVRFLERVPKSAAVNESVELVKMAGKRSAAGFVNAVLRKCRTSPELSKSLAGDRATTEILEAAKRSMPGWLLDRWTTNFGPQAALALAWSSARVPHVSLRVRGRSAETSAVHQELAAQGIAVRSGRFAGRALIVEQGRTHDLKVLREFRALIQDEASQAVAELVAPRAGDRLLDVCAAPGVKSDAARLTMGSGQIVACDVGGKRLREMRKLGRALGAGGPAIHFVQLDATLNLPFSIKFERVLVDAPCSGTGTLARNPEIKWRLRPSDIERHSETQKKILSHALQRLAPGGRLVYATCSLEPEENEQVVETVLGAMSKFRTLSAAELRAEFPRMATLFDQRGYFHTRPDLHGTEGFFAAVLTAIN